MPSYEFLYKCPNHKWVPQSACPDSPSGIICGLCLEKGRKVKVRTRPKYTNSAGSFIKNLKENLYFTNNCEESKEDVTNRKA